MKRTTQISLGLLSLMVMGQANAQSFNSGANVVENDRGTSEQRGSQRGSERGGEGQERAANGEREPTVNDLLMASGNNLSESTIQQISQLQEKKSLLDAQITTLEAERNYLELNNQIKDLGGQNEMSNVSMVGVQGKNGNLSSIISYNDRLIEVSRGDIIANEWVVTTVSKKKVAMLNMDDKSEMVVSKHGYQLIVDESEAEEESEDAKEDNKEVKDEAVSTSLSNEEASF
jgi:Tfp pilus assembly protein PilP